MVCVEKFALLNIENDGFETIIHYIVEFIVPCLSMPCYSISMCLFQNLNLRNLIWFYCLEEKNINHYMLKFRKLIVIIGWLIVCICITVYINICIVLHLQTWTHKYIYRVIFLNTNTTHNFRTCSFRLSVVLS